MGKMPLYLDRNPYRTRSTAAVIAAGALWSSQILAAPIISQNAQPDSALNTSPAHDSNINVKILPPNAPEDEAVAVRVRAKLARDATLNSSNITVSSNSAVITLTGSTSSADARSEATVATEMVEGVKSVVNQLVVNPAANPMAK